MLKRLIQDQAFTAITVRGVPVRLQASSLLWPALAVYAGYITNPGGWHGAIFMSLFVMLLHACAMLHELGHILLARYFGASVNRVRISGMGAFVRVENPVGITPRQDLLIALGGPAVSALLSVILSLLMWNAVGSYSAMTLLAALMQGNVAAMLVLLTATNVLLTLFNLLPVFPMDGGRALSSLLALFLPSRQATRMVSGFGQIMAIAGVLVVAILTNNLWLRLTTVLTAGLVFLVSLRESRIGRVRQVP